MSEIEKPHKDNAAGPFYVCDGCCTACGIPFFEAPEMFAYDEQSHCYVKRQPGDKGELNRMLRTVFSAELECIRYRGSDKDVLRRLAEGGVGHLSDIPVPGISSVSRDHVTFDVVDPLDNLLLERDLATDFQRYLRSEQNEYVTYRFTPISSNGETTSFSYAWYEDDFHPVEFHFLGLPNHRWLVVSNTSFHVHDWLAAGDKFCNIRWYTKEQWNSSRDWQETPW